jgi:ABC-2 type transport system permease protein/oleandomycin transport system permease protein
VIAIAEPARIRVQPSAAQMARWAISDALVMTRRNLLVWLRVPAYIVFTVVQPVIFVLLFRYVFGGAIRAPGSGGYVSYLMPGIIGQTAAFATFATAIALAQEATKGVIDRFRAMPMARSAVLAGRLIADSIRMLIVILVIIGVGYAVGFRFQNGIAGAVGMVALAEAFGIAVCSVSAFVGLAIKDEESVQAFGLIWIFPLTFVSSAFVPIATMPGWLQVFANNQPVTLVINAMRAMALGGPQFPLNPALWESLLWLAGVLIVFTPLAVRSYRHVG